MSGKRLLVVDDNRLVLEVVADFFEPHGWEVARAEDGAAIAVEVWDMPVANLGRFVAGVPAPLGIGTVTLQDGRHVKGFICEGAALANAQDITHFGGWRAYCMAA